MKNGLEIIGYKMKMWRYELILFGLVFLAGMSMFFGIALNSIPLGILSMIFILIILLIFIFTKTED